MPLESIVPNLVLFARVNCRSQDFQIDKKNSAGMAIACLGAFMAVLFRITIGDEARTYFIGRKQMEINAFATVDSFTVECKLAKH